MRFIIALTGCIQGIEEGKGDLEDVSCQEKNKNGEKMRKEKLLRRQQECFRWNALPGEVALREAEPWFIGSADACYRAVVLQGCPETPGVPQNPFRAA